MNIDWIETYLDILETRNFNATAENLSLTQSTVSHRIQKLEETLGEPLFMRGRNGAVPTLAGEKFESHARALRKEWHQARRNLGTQDQISIGIQYDIANPFAGQIVRALRANYPRATLSIEVDYSQQMNRDLEHGNLDFAIIYTPNNRADLFYDRIASLEYIMVANQPMQFKDLHVRDYIFPNISPAFAHAHGQRLPDLSEASLRCGQSDALIQFIKELGGASYVLSHFADNEIDKNQLHAVTGAPILHQDVYLTSHAKDRSKFVNAKMKARILGALNAQQH